MSNYSVWRTFGEFNLPPLLLKERKKERKKEREREKEENVQSLNLGDFSVKSRIFSFISAALI